MKEKQTGNLSLTVLQERVYREQSAHTKKNDVLANSYRLKNRFKHIWTYPSRKRYDESLLGFLKNIRGFKVLDYGCGRGDLSLYLLGQGCMVYGIDISPDYIQEAKQRCTNAGYDQSKFEFDVMDAHVMGFPAGWLDIVVGLGILHHLDAGLALKEIHRVLKPGGRLLLQEPLADNPFLKLFRKLTPKARTEDEKPFTAKDLKNLKQSTQWQPELCFCGLLEAPIAMLTSVLMPGHPDNFILSAVDRLEGIFHHAGILDAWNQYVLINLVKRG